MKVLIADDEIKVCRLIQHLVDWDALEMDIIGFANDGKTAYESICEKKPDIVITDIRMPVYDGLELIRRAKETNPEINFIVISGYSQFEYAQQAIKYGVKDYLLKPLKKRELENSLIEIKESHESLIKSARIRNELESIIEASREHIHENFLMKTLQNSATNPLKADMSLEQLNEQYGCKFHKGFFTAVRVRPFFSKNSDKSAGDSEEFVMNKIHQMVKEKLEIYCETYMSTVYQDEIVCILNTVDKEIEPVRKKLKHLIVNVSNLKTVFPDIRIRIGQGNTHSSYMGITDSFREAELAIMNRMGENEDTYICYSEDSKSGKTKEEIFDSGLRNEILTYQERMDIEGTLRLVDKVGEKLKPFKYDGKLVYEVFGELVETLRFGIYSFDEGEIILDGKNIKFSSPSEALQNHVSMVHQELNQVLNQTVMENMWLGRFPMKHGLVDDQKMYEDTKAIFDDLDIQVNPKVKIGTLKVSQKQMIEIAKAVSYNSKVIVMDEPTSSLTEKEVEHLFKIIEKLKKKNTSIIYISHKMEE